MPGAAWKGAPNGSQSAQRAQDEENQGAGNDGGEGVCAEAHLRMLQTVLAVRPLLDRARPFAVCTRERSKISKLMRSDGQLGECVPGFL